MTAPRREIFKPDEVGDYHCISRCVRRAFLCGFDAKTGVSYEHRRTWIRTRLAFLLDVFAIDLTAYAIMTNHVHTLIRNRPDIAKTWSAEEVARRWRLLFPLRRRNGLPEEPNHVEIDAITSRSELVELYRERLSSISWFNRCLCENIARRANREDECTGRFWQGRFKCQRIFDICGLLACSVYIDLNPIRAGVASTPEDSDYTSIQDRIRTARKLSEVAQLTPMPKLVPLEEVAGGAISIQEYLTLVDETGRTIVSGKASVPNHLPPLLVRLDINPNKWIDTTVSQRHRFRRIVGSFESLILAARTAGKNWYQGLRSAHAAFL